MSSALLLSWQKRYASATSGSCHRSTISANAATSPRRTRSTAATPSSTVMAHVHPAVDAAPPRLVAFLGARRPGNKCNRRVERPVSPATSATMLAARGARMGNNMGLVFLVPAVGALGLFSLAAVWAWAINRRRERESLYHVETVRKISETHGQPAVLDYMLEV